MGGGAISKLETLAGTNENGEPIGLLTLPH